MAFATLMQCESCWSFMLASFDEKYKKLMSDHLDAKKEMELV
jgi:hypothetical protein